MRQLSRTATAHWPTMHAAKISSQAERLVLLLCTRTTGAQEELHGKIDKLYEDTSDWKTRLDNSTKLVDERYGDAD